MSDSERSSSPTESRFEQWLAKSVYRVDCLDTLTLGEYALELLAGAGKERVAQHLENCPKCRQELIFLQNFMREES